jgi:carbon storage regulator CsrA
MLTLARKVGEVVMVGEGAVVVVAISAGQVKLGFVFDRAVPIVRREIATSSPAAVECDRAMQRRAQGRSGART